MGELNSIQDVFDWFGGSPVFWVIGGLFVLVALGALLRGGRR